MESAEAAADLVHSGHDVCPNLLSELRVVACIKVYFPEFSYCLNAEGANLSFLNKDVISWSPWSRTQVVPVPPWEAENSDVYGVRGSIAGLDSEDDAMGEVAAPAAEEPGEVHPNH